jgi:hypothetical protein
MLDGGAWIDQFALGQRHLRPDFVPRDALTVRAHARAVLATTALASSLAAGLGCSAGDAARTGVDGGRPHDATPDSRGPGAVCGDTRTDPHNCGTCGHDCLGGACESGACVALAPNVLASGQHTPGGIVVDATHVYWVDRGTYSIDQGTYAGAQVVKCAKSGCNNAPTVLATGSWTHVTNLAVDSASVYWGASGQIFKCSIDGCSDHPTVLWSSDGGAQEIALDDAGVYFDIPDAQQLFVCSIDGCDGGTEVTFGEGGLFSVRQGFPRGLFGSLVAIAIDNEDLYVAAGGSVVACRRGTCSETARAVAVSTALLAPLLAVDATNVYFASSTGFGGFTGNPNGQDKISFAAKSGVGQASSTLLDGLSFPSAIAVDGNALYVAQWGDQNATGALRSSGAGRIAKCAVAGCGGASTTVQDYVNYPQGIAVDDANVYWTDFGTGTDTSGSDVGRVMMRAK